MCANHEAVRGDTEWRLRRLGGGRGTYGGREALCLFLRNRHSAIPGGVDGFDGDLAVPVGSRVRIDLCQKASWGVLGRELGWVVLLWQHWWASSLGGCEEDGAEAGMCRCDGFRGPWRISTS